MKWSLILGLSVFGFIMAVATIFWIPTRAEPFFWLPIFVYCAYIIARKVTGRYFLHGFMVSIFNCIWITSLHYIFFNAYMVKHPDMADMNSKMMEGNDSLRNTMLVFSPVVGVISGLILGLFSFIASKIVKRRQV